MADFHDVALDMGRESLGPDDLCRLANLLERPTKDGARRTREGMRECADAWEADIQKGANIATELARQLRTAEARIEALKIDKEGDRFFLQTLDIALNAASLDLKRRDARIEALERRVEMALAAMPANVDGGKAIRRAYMCGRAVLAAKENRP